MEKMVAKRGEEEERRKYRRRRRRITFDDDDYDENNRTIRHAAKRWLREERTGRRFNLVITSTHDSRRAPMTKGPSAEPWWRSPNEAVHRHGSWREQGQVYAALVDKHETSRGLISGRANFHERSRRLTNFSLSIFEKALSFKLRSTGWTALPACLPPPDSNLFPPFLCPFKHFRLRVLILLCKSTNESFENNRNRDRNILEDIKTKLQYVRIRVLKFTNFLYLEKNYALNTRLEEMEEL